MYIHGKGCVPKIQTFKGNLLACTGYSSDFQCQGCRKGYHLQGKECIKLDEDDLVFSNFYEYYDKKRKNFDACVGSENCISCEKFGKCMECNKFGCYECMVGFDIDGLGMCRKCPEGCLFCWYHICSSCGYGYDLQNSKCVKTSGCFINNCILCDEIECYDCVEGYEFQSGKCVEKN